MFLINKEIKTLNSFILNFDLKAAVGSMALDMATGNKNETEIELGIKVNALQND